MKEIDFQLPEQHDGRCTTLVMPSGSLTNGIHLIPSRVNAVNDKCFRMTGTRRY